MSREALVVIDAQNDFVLPGRPLTVNGAAACLPKVMEARESAHARCRTTAATAVRACACVRADRIVPRRASTLLSRDRE